MLEFTLPTAATKQRLSLACRATSTRPAKPILGNVKLSAENETVFVEATDLEMAFRCEIPGSRASGDGAVLLPATKFAAIVSKIDEDTFSVLETKSGASIACNSGKFTLHTDKPADWPSVNFTESPSWKCTVQANALAAAIRRGLTAVGEGARFAYGGIGLEISGSTLSLMSTEEHMCVFSEIAAEGASGDFFPIVPERAAQFLERLCCDGDVKLSAGPNTLIASGDGWQLMARLLEGRLPVAGIRSNTRDARPSKAETVSIPCGILLTAIERAALLTSEAHTGINLEFGGGAVEFLSKSEAGTAGIRLPIEWGGKKSVTLKPGYVTAFLRALDPAASLTLGFGREGLDGISLVTEDGTWFAVAGYAKE